MSAGTANDADCRISGDLIAWADDIVVMEKRYAQQIRTQYGRLLLHKRLVCLNIRDRYAFMQPELIEALRSKASRWMV